MSATKEFRIVALAAAYTEPRPVVSPEGKTEERLIQTFGRRGEVIKVEEAEAKRLLDLGAIKSVDEPLGYEEMNESQLKDLAHTRGVVVRGSGANGEAVEADYVNALRNADVGATLASSASGGVQRTAAGQSQGVYVEEAVTPTEPPPAEKPAPRSAAKK